MVAPNQMKHQTKPLLIDNLAFAKKQDEVSHQIDLEGCERLLEMLVPEQVLTKKISYTLTGLASQLHLPGLKLQIEATLPVICQRCLQPMDLDLSLTHVYVISEVEPESFEGDDDVDWLEVSREMNVNELVEDELLIAMPLGPSHQHACKTLPKEEVEKPNPFAVLKDLIK